MSKLPASQRDAKQCNTIQHRLRVERIDKKDTVKICTNVTLSLATQCNVVTCSATQCPSLHSMSFILCAPQRPPQPLCAHHSTIKHPLPSILSHSSAASCLQPPATDTTPALKSSPIDRYSTLPSFANIQASPTLLNSNLIIMMGPRCGQCGGNFNGSAATCSCDD
jgi:hypothetical protein